MNSHALHTTLRGVSLVVLILMVVAALYTGYIATTYWTGIGV